MIQREEWEPAPRQVYNPRTRRWEVEGAVEQPPVAAEPSRREWMMPFGKFAGDPLSEIGSGYLRWVLRECDIDPDLDEAIRQELDRR